MWISEKVVDWFRISKDSVDALREELASVRAERDALQRQLITIQVNFDWIRMQINSLQMERTALMEKAYDIKVPAPEIIRQPQIDPTFDPKNFSFDDVGDELARTMGFPIYSDK